MNKIDKLIAEINRQLNIYPEYDNVHGVLESCKAQLLEDKKALELLANTDRDDGTGSIMTDEVDRMGYPVIKHFSDIAKTALGKE